VAEGLLGDALTLCDEEGNVKHGGLGNGGGTTRAAGTEMRTKPGARLFGKLGIVSLSTLPTHWLDSSMASVERDGVIHNCMRLFCSIRMNLIKSVESEQGIWRAPHEGEKGTKRGTSEEEHLRWKLTDKHPQMDAYILQLVDQSQKIAWALADNISTSRVVNSLVSINWQSIETDRYFMLPLVVIKIPMLSMLCPFWSSSIYK
jgi:hypothetical protein